jgi:ABC-type uncharacterized transport system auxiliary subunit
MGTLIIRGMTMQRLLLTIIAALFLSSCATQKNVPLQESFWQEKQHKVAVVSIKPAVPGVTMVGSQGLLDLAINSAMASKLDAQLSKMDLEWYYKIPSDMTEKLKQRKVIANMAGTNISDDDRNIASIAGQNNVNDILVIKLQAVGVIRRYTCFIPAGAPQAYCVLEGKLLNPVTKEVKWRHLAEVKLPVQGNWDQPPTFPNVNNAVKVAIDSSRQEVLDSFFSGH